MKEKHETAYSGLSVTTETGQAVLRFFLNLYTAQLGVSEEDTAETEIICLDPENPGSDHTYELRVRWQGYKSRRMSLAPLGEGSGSKSTCFKVIYDDLLVVKIPPSPIREFDDYLESIAAEIQIADRLGPDIECIAPSLSAILKKIPRFAASSDIAQDRLEKVYTDLLRKSPWFHDYLKIGDTFAFFMSLSRNSFLGHVIEKMHRSKNKICENIFSQFDILWNLAAFEGLFGSENSHIFFSISEIYTDYEEKVNLILKKAGINPSAFIYKRKEWFLLWLAEKEIPSTLPGLSSGVVASLKGLMAQLYENREEDVDAHRRMMQDCVYRKSFEQNRVMLKGIVSGLLVLLCGLKQRGIAIRDLKPDNIFVAGSSHLHQSGEIRLGLIDFETSVNFHGTDKEMFQPFIGGTPSYATPSHLMSNEILIHAFSGLPRIFHLQDWYAAVGMIYYAVTGERLFEKTRFWISETGRLMQDGAVSGKDSFVQCSRVFWYSAVREFRKKISARSVFFLSLEIMLSRDVQEMLRQEMLQEQTEIQKKIQVHVNAQSFFKSEKSRSDLIRSDCVTISRCRKNWESGVNIPETRPEIRSDIIRLFRNLEELKAEYEKCGQMINAMQKSPGINAYELLTMMFHIVFHAMYKEEWGDIKDENALRAEIMEIVGEAYDADFAAEGSPEVSYEETVSYESTVTPEETVSYEKTISHDDRPAPEETL
ncbi:MAG: hypothetical protein AB7S75_08665 [Desulfococcaceae bacterium]